MEILPMGNCGAKVIAGIQTVNDRQLSVEIINPLIDYLFIDRNANVDWTKGTCQVKYKVRNKSEAVTFIFSDSLKNTGGKNLERFIKKHDLGKLWYNKPVKNNNSLNRIKVWTWNINQNKFKELAEKMVILINEICDGKEYDYNTFRDSDVYNARRFPPIL